MIEWLLLVYRVGTEEPILTRPERAYTRFEDCHAEAERVAEPGKTYGFCKPRQSAK